MKWSRLVPLAWRESRFARRRLFCSCPQFVGRRAGGHPVLCGESGRGVGTRPTPLGEPGAACSRSGSAPSPHRDAEAGCPRRADEQLCVHGTRAAYRRDAAGAGARRGGAVSLYGTIETRPAGLWSGWAAGRNALVDPGLLVALGAPGRYAGPGRRTLSDCGDAGAGAGRRGCGDGVCSARVHPRPLLAETPAPVRRRVEREAFLRIPTPRRPGVWSARKRRDYGRSGCAPAPRKSSSGS